MLRLIGSLASSYCNIVKIALLEKGVDFEEAAVTADGRVLTRLAGSSDWSEEPLTEDHRLEFQRISPAGKIPVLEIDGDPLTETAVIVEYLDETRPHPPLFPSDALARAHVRELIRHIDLYVDLPARRLAPEVFYGQELPPEEKRAVEPLLQKGARSVASLAKFEPYIAGSELTAADLYAHCALGPASIATRTLYDWDLLAELPGLAELIELLDQRESFRRVEADRARELR